MSNTFFICHAFGDTCLLDLRNGPRHAPQKNQQSEGLAGVDRCGRMASPLEAAGGNSFLLWIGGVVQWQRRTCAKCGKDKDLSGGKTYENGHFVCYACNSGVLGSKHCPLCRYVRKN